MAQQESVHTAHRWAGAVEIAAAIRAREVSAVEMLEEQLDRIARLDADLHAVVTLDAEGARARAQQADTALTRGDVWGPLHGVGITIEDIHATAGIRSTFGGYPALADHVPGADATVVARLKAAGAIVVGKTNGPCLGEDSIFPRTRNPWNPGRAPGKSSTGSAVAVAAGLTPLDIACDTRGSIQCPATFCGVFGMRPTEHRVPLTGSVFIDPIRKHRVLTTAGPMARSVTDLRLALQVISGPDGHDPEVAPVPWRDAVAPELDGLRIGYAPDFPVGTAADIRAAIDDLAVDLDNLGAVIDDQLPGSALTEQEPLMAELFSMLAPAAAPVPGAEEPSTRPLWDYLAALDRRDRYMTGWDRYLATHDAFLCPAVSMCAWPVDEEPADDRLNPILLSQLSGCPMVVIPVGLDSNGVPTAAQLVGRRWQDERLLAIAEAITAATGRLRHPAP